MPLPNLSDEQLTLVIQLVAAYIGQQREIYRPAALPLSQMQRTAMLPFFSPSTLDAARVVILTGERVANPPFYAGLEKIGFEAGSLPDFTNMSAITFLDTVVTHGPYDDRLLFHELVHVAQYEKLGLAEFAAKYVKGFLRGGSYEAIPLEVNAYELDGRFAAAPASAFSVHEEVQDWIDLEMF